MTNNQSFSERINLFIGEKKLSIRDFEKKCDVQVLQKLMGHSDISTTMIYVHIVAKTQKTQLLAAFDGF